MIYNVLIYILLVSVFLCIYKMGRGPTPVERAVAVYTLGTIVVALSALFSLKMETDFFLNVSISWALLSFIGTMAIAKFLEGRGLDE